MKKLLYIIGNILIVSLLAGAYVLQYFAERKLGMNRWIVFKIRKVEEAVPIGVLRYAAVALVLILTAALVVSYNKYRRKLKRIVLAMTAVTVLLAVGYLVFTAAFSQEQIRAYYLMLPLIGLACLVQIVKTALAVKLCRK